MVTNIELYKMFLSKVRKSKVGSVPPEDFLLWINKAQRVVVDNKLAAMGLNTRHEDDLLPLHINDASLEAITGSAGYFKLPSNYLRKDSVYVTLTKGTETLTHVKCIPARANRISSILSSSYDAPTVDRCYFVYEVKGTFNAIHFYCPSSYTVTAYMCYYKEPALIAYVHGVPAIELIWNASMINEIVDTSSALYIAGIADSRLQSELAMKNQTNTNF